MGNLKVDGVEYPTEVHLVPDWLSTAGLMEKLGEGWSVHRADSVTSTADEFIDSRIFTLIKY